MPKKNFGQNLSPLQDSICSEARIFATKFLLALGCIIILFLAAGCQTLPPDVPVCVEFSPVHGRCVHIISGDKFDVDDQNTWNGKTWWELRHEMVLLPAQSWAEIKAYIIKSCKKYGNCQDVIPSWDRTLEMPGGLLSEKLEVPTLP